MKKDGVFKMKQRTRIYYALTQRSEMWDRWKQGESMPHKQGGNIITIT